MEQRTTEWYDARLGKFSGSGISHIMSSVKLKRAENATKKIDWIEYLKRAGCKLTDDEYNSKKVYELKEIAEDYPEERHWDLADGTITYIEKKIAEEITGEREEIPINFDMQRGIDLEPEALLEWNSIYDHILGEVPGFIPYKEHSGGSPDFLGEVVDSSNTIIGAEFKCPTQHVHTKYINRIEGPQDLKSINTNYYWQVLSYMLFSKAQYWHWVSYHPLFGSNKVFVVGFDAEDPQIKSDLELLDWALDKAYEEKLLILEKF